MTPTKATNRETWLEALVDELRPYLAARNYELPENLRISCGWPSTRALSTKRRRIGEHWNPKASKDGVSQVFISPVLDAGLDVAETVVHELGHALLPEAGHKGPFRAFMKDVDLKGKPTATYAGEGLKKDLEAILKALPTYPNAALDKLSRPVKKQSTRMRKLSCDGQSSGTHEKEYILRGAKATLEMGIPQCPLCHLEMVVEEPEDDEEPEDS